MAADRPRLGDNTAIKQRLVATKGLDRLPEDADDCLFGHSSGDLSPRFWRVPRERIRRCSRNPVLAARRPCPDQLLAGLTFQLLLETRDASLLLVNPGPQEA